MLRQSYDISDDKRSCLMTIVTFCAHNTLHTNINHAGNVCLCDIQTQLKKEFFTTVEGLFTVELTGGFNYRALLGTMKFNVESYTFNFNGNVVCEYNNMNNISEFGFTINTLPAYEDNHGYIHIQFEIILISLDRSFLNNISIIIRSSHISKNYKSLKTTMSRRKVDNLFPMEVGDICYYENDDNRNIIQPCSNINNIVPLFAGTSHDLYDNPVLVSKKYKGIIIYKNIVSTGTIYANGTFSYFSPFINILNDIHTITFKDNIVDYVGSWTTIFDIPNSYPKNFGVNISEAKSNALNIEDYIIITRKNDFGLYLSTVIGTQMSGDNQIIIYGFMGRKKTDEILGYIIKYFNHIKSFPYKNYEIGGGLIC